MCSFSDSTLIMKEREQDFKLNTLQLNYSLTVVAATQMQVVWWLHPYIQIHTHIWQSAFTSSLSAMEHMSTSPSSAWMSIAKKHIHHMITLRWGMAILRTLHWWWEDSVEMAAMSDLPCKPPKITWGSGEVGEHIKLSSGLKFRGARFAVAFIFQFLASQKYPKFMATGEREEG